MTDVDQEKVASTLSDLAFLVKNGLVTRKQVLNAIGGEQEKPTIQTLSQKINLQRIMYYIGGFIVLLGIVIFVAQFWSDMSQITKAVVTLGSAVSAFTIGYYFYNNTQSKDFGHVFLVISAALFPLGVGTSLDTIGIHATTSEGASINAALLFMIFYTSYAFLRAAIFLPFSIIAASAFYYSFAFLLLKNTGPPTHFYEYQTLGLGLTYLLLGYYFSQTKRVFMTNLLYFFGLVMILGTAMALQGFSPKINIFWQLIYPFLLIAVFGESIKLQNKVFLIMATVFTFGEIIKITSEYFSKSIGWPISLIVAGLVIMEIGYMSFELNKKILKTTTKNPEDFIPATSKPPAAI